MLIKRNERANSVDDKKEIVERNENKFKEVEKMLQIDKKKRTLSSTT